MTTEEYFAWLRTADGGHCLYAKEISEGIYCAIKPLMFHWTMIIGEIGDQCSYADRFCYADRNAAIRAIFTWNGEGQPTGWHRHPLTGRRRPDGDPAREYIAF